MRVKQFLLQEPTEGRVRTRHRVYNLVCLGLTGFASTLMVFNNSFSFRLSLLPVNYPCLLTHGYRRSFREAGASCFYDATCRHFMDGIRVHSGCSLRRRRFGVNHS